MESIPLNEENLPKIALAQQKLKKTNVTPLPTYPRALSSFDGLICHVGVGAFHRTHEAVYTHEVLLDQMNGSGSSPQRWGIVGVGIRGASTRDVLKEQDYLYTVLGKDGTTTSVTVVGSLVGFVLSQDDPDGHKLIDFLADSRTRIVSLTITEKGYLLNTSGDLNLENKDVRHDLDHPGEPPRSAAGTLVRALALRKQRGLPPFTVLSCDNLPRNGRLARGMVLGFLKAAGDGALLAWAESHCRFPCTMVDRITPSTTALDDSKTDTYSDEVRKIVQFESCVQDRWPVVSEPFKQWVIEDSFACGRPAWETRGALFTDCVEPFELMKLRLLNAGHSAMCYGAFLLGHRYMDCAMLDNTVRGFLAAFMKEQAATVDSIPEEDLKNYQIQVLERFSNPFIKDTLARIAQDGSHKLAATMRESALQNAREGRSVACFSCAVACWTRFMVGVDESGEVIDCVVDPRAVELTALARAAFQCASGCTEAPCHAIKPPDVKNVALLLAAVFGDDFAETDAIVEAVLDALSKLAMTSTRQLMTQLANEEHRQL